MTNGDEMKGIPVIKFGTSVSVVDYLQRFFYFN